MLTTERGLLLMSTLTAVLAVGPSAQTPPAQPRGKGRGAPWAPRPTWSRSWPERGAGQAAVP